MVKTVKKKEADFSRLVKKMRKKLKLTLEQFATLFEVSAQDVSLWERREANPGACTERRIRNAAMLCEGQLLFTSPENVIKWLQQRRPESWAEWIQQSRRDGDSPLDACGSNYATQAWLAELESIKRGEFS